MPPSVSIIIPTFQREKPVRDTLNAVLAQTIAGCSLSTDSELIVVDQTLQHEPETQAILTNPGIRHLRLEHPNLPAARNAGIRAASGDIVLFLDDDIYPGPDLITLHRRHYNDPTIGSVAGRVHVSNRCFLSAKPDPAGHPWPDGPNIFDRNQAGERAFAPGGHLSVRRDLAMQAGLFDENFIGNAVAEEEDFGFAIRRLGYRVIYDPQPWIIHLAAPSGGCREQRDIREGALFYRNKLYFALKNVAGLDFWRVLADVYYSGVLSGSNRLRRQIAFLVGCWQGWQVYQRAGWRLKKLPYRISP